MKQTRSNRSRRPVRWAVTTGALVATMAWLAVPAVAGPKGTILVRKLGNAKITVDGDLKDWPLDQFTRVAEQPLFPQAQNSTSTTAMGDVVVFDVNRVGLFNDTGAGAFAASLAKALPSCAPTIPACGR